MWSGLASGAASFLGELDRVCGQFALALQHAEFRVYAVLTLIMVLSFLIFPPRDDPDRA